MRLIGHEPGEDVGKVGLVVDAVEFAGLRPVLAATVRTAVIVCLVSEVEFA
jgi:hypothetical protein